MLLEHAACGLPAEDVDPAIHLDGGQSPAPAWASARACSTVRWRDRTTPAGRSCDRPREDGRRRRTPRRPAGRPRDGPWVSEAPAAWLQRSVPGVVDDRGVREVHAGSESAHDDDAPIHHGGGARASRLRQGRPRHASRSAPLVVEPQRRDRRESAGPQAADGVRECRWRRRGACDGEEPADRRLVPRPDAAESSRYTTDAAEVPPPVIPPAT